MKPLNSLEIEMLAEDLGALVGARLQEVQSGPNVLVLGLYLVGTTHWLRFEFHPALPLLLHLTEPTAVPTGGKLPIALFISAHGKNLRLTDAARDEKAGRVLHLTFGNEPDPLRLECRLFPHGVNLLAAKVEKSISLNKIKELKEAASDSPDTRVMAVRSLEQIKREWSDTNKRVEDRDPARAARALEKKREGLEKLKADLASKRKFENFSQLGEWLKTHGTLNVPEEFKALIARDRPLSENIEQAFQKAKAMRRKMEENQARIVKLEEEIQNLQKGGTVKESPRSGGKSIAKTAAKAAGTAAKYRTLKLPEPFEAYLGKSAKDNLALLRAAQAWDIWLHLRDLPGAHVIIRRPRQTEVPPAILEQVMVWLAKESRRFSKGDIVEVQFQEARRVRPLKGDKLGRVTVQNPLHRRFRL